MNQAEEIRESLAPLIEKARNEGKWLWCAYQDLWFSPDSLEKSNAEGKFLWGPINWHLRNPSEKLAEAEKRAAFAVAEANRIRELIR